MGYMTSYSMNVCGFIPPSVLESVEREIEQMNVFEEEDIRVGWSVWTTWYDWEEDMALLSKRFPDVLFKLHGTGEDSEDLWDAYFFGGKVQVCPGKIVYDDFDPAKLNGKNIKQTKYSYQ